MIPPAHTRPETADTVLRDALEAKGQRFTEQRAAVFRFLSQSREHPTADEVYTAVRGEISDISLATVYKALETLVHCGLASKLAYGDGSARYDGRTDDHCHARCLRCGTVRDIPGPNSDRLIEQMAIEGDFEIQGCRIEVVGLCADCSD